MAQPQLPSGRSPDYDVTVYRKSRNPAIEKDIKGRVGAAWTNEDDSITIVLNPCVLISSMEGYTIRMFPAGRDFKRPAPVQAERPPLPDHLKKKYGDDADPQYPG